VLFGSAFTDVLTARAKDANALTNGTTVQRRCPATAAHPVYASPIVASGPPGKLGKVNYHTSAVVGDAGRRGQLDRFPVSLARGLSRSFKTTTGELAKIQAEARRIRINQQAVHTDTS